MDEHEAPDTLNGDLLLWDNLGSIEHIEGEVFRERLIEELGADPARVQPTTSDAFPLHPNQLEMRNTAKVMKGILSH